MVALTEVSCVLHINNDVALTSGNYNFFLNESCLGKESCRLYLSNMAGTVSVAQYLVNLARYNAFRMNNIGKGIWGKMFHRK